MDTYRAEDLFPTVGTLAGFQHRQKMANDPKFRAAQKRKDRAPTTMLASLGRVPAPSMRQVLGIAIGGH
jgi:hypothetical protein